MRMLPIAVVSALTLSACGATPTVADDADAAGGVRRDGPITAWWRAEACRGRAFGADQIGVVTSAAGGGETGEGGGTAVASDDAAAMLLTAQGQTVALSVPTLGVRGATGELRFEARTWTVGEARAAGFDLGWTLVAFEGDCGTDGAITPVTRLRRIDGTPAFARRLGDTVRELARAHLADVTRLLPPMPEAGPDDAELSEQVSRGPGQRRTVAAATPDVTWQADAVVVRLQISVRVLARGYACPPGADNPYWRHGFGFMTGTTYARVCSLSRGNEAPVCRDLAPVAIPRPRCPPLP